MEDRLNPTNREMKNDKWKERDGKYRGAELLKKGWTVKSLFSLSLIHLLAIWKKHVDS